VTENCSDRKFIISGLAVPALLSGIAETLTLLIFVKKKCLVLRFLQKTIFLSKVVFITPDFQLRSNLK